MSLENNDCTFNFQDRTWTVKVNELEGTDDFYIQMPEEVLALSGLKAGDPVHWIANNDGTYTLIQGD